MDRGGLPALLSGCPRAVTPSSERSAAQNGLGERDQIRRSAEQRDEGLTGYPREAVLRCVLVVEQTSQGLGGVPPTWLDLLDEICRLAVG